MWFCYFIVKAARTQSSYKLLANWVFQQKDFFDNVWSCVEDAAIISASLKFFREITLNRKQVKTQVVAQILLPPSFFIQKRESYQSKTTHSKISIISNLFGVSFHRFFQIRYIQFVIRWDWVDILGQPTISTYDLYFKFWIFCKNFCCFCQF